MRLSHPTNGKVDPRQPQVLQYNAYKYKVESDIRASTCDLHSAHTTLSHTTPGCLGKCSHGGGSSIMDQPNSYYILEGIRDFQDFKK